MKRKIAFLLVLAIILTVFICGKETQPVEAKSEVRQLHVSGAALCDEKGNAVQLKGISTHGIAWYPQYINDKCFKQLKGWGVNVVRLAMYSAEYNGYSTGGEENKKALKKQIEKGVSLAQKYGMYVIIDWHIMNQDGNPLTNKADAREFFTWASKKYKNTNNVIYEICNEPCNGTSWDDITEYASEIIPLIRKNASKSVIIVGTPNWSQELDRAVEKPLKYKNIMYALHFYAATQKDDLRNTLKRAIEKKLPVFVTEFSICEASGNGNNDKESAKNWMEIINKAKISYCLWNLSNKNESSAVIKPEVTKTSGFTEKDLTESGLWFRKQLKK